MSNSLMTRVVEAKTADYTVIATDTAKVFTNRGAGGAVVFTLPASTAVPAGWWCEFYTCAAQTIAIASSPSDTLVVHADLTADSITTAATIGQHLTAINDGTGFLIVSNPTLASTVTNAVTAVVIATN